MHMCVFVFKICKKKKRHSHRILLWGRQFANITYQIKAFYQLDQALVLIFVHSASFNSIAGTRTTATTINIDDAVHAATVAVTDKPIVVFSLSLSLSYYLCYTFESTHLTQSTYNWKFYWIFAGGPVAGLVYCAISILYVHQVNSILFIQADFFSFTSVQSHFSIGIRIIVVRLWPEIF